LLSTHADSEVWIGYFLLFCYSLCVCTFTDFSAEDKASGVKFWTAVHRRPRQGISIWVTLLPEAQNRPSNWSARALS